MQATPLRPHHRHTERNLRHDGSQAGAKPMSPRGFERVQGLRRVVYDSQDYHEGLQAFKEKRNPVFTGK